MRSTRKVFFGLMMALSAGALVAPIARADLVQSVSQIIPLSPANNPTTFVSIPQFNPASGSLLFVVVRISALFSESVQAENLAASPANITVLATETINVTLPSFISLLPAQGTAGIPLSNASMAAFDGSINFTGPSSASFSLSPNPQNLDIANLTVSSNLGNFIGNGNLPAFAFNSTGYFQAATDIGPTAYSSALLGGGTITVDYHYTPEPASLCLLAGATGVLMIRRRGRR